ncbi:MAG: hypothetical protein VX466_05760, partial [Myxococcota bacterium]|nr:hypothetical protein [Myxococcota bacterium]
MRHAARSIAVLASLGLVTWTGCSCEEERNPARFEPESTLEHRLEVLGYADWDRAATPQSLGKQGVVRASPDVIAAGLNLYNSQPRSRALLIDSRGDLVHAWSSADTAGGGWHHIEPDRDGSLYAIVKHESLEKLDRHSQQLWKLDIPAHHDLAIASDGALQVLTRVLRNIETRGRKVPILDTEIVQISSDGEILGRLALSSLLADWIPEQRLDEIARAIASSPAGESIPG